ncbi:MAG TPA: GNAT family N-acetyltransferase [Streptosporangiaceae bacterium]|nr:GNAT family N-acetyltransferase [Streptosporangiaceae bacterium]
MPSPDIRIEPAVPADAGEILTVQRAAYVAEAQLYGDPFILPLVESLDQIRALVSGAAVVLVARHGVRLAGAVQGRLRDQTCVIGRHVVAPDLQGRGIGTRLMRAIEDAVAGRAGTLALSAGHLSDGTLRLYRRLGYAETHRERFAAHLTLVHMRKKLDGPA